MEKNKMMKNRKKVDFRELFSNNRFVLLFSIVLAFVIWTAISMTASPEETFLIKDVPVDFSLKGSMPEQLGLQAFGNTDFKVDVEVYGKRYIVSNLRPEDIKCRWWLNPQIIALSLRLTLFLKQRCRFILTHIRKSLIL